MKTILLILTIFAIPLFKPVCISARSNNTSAGDSVLLPKQAMKNITIITPHSEIYDDGTLKKSFAGYSLSDSENNQLIQVNSVQDIPVTLKLKEGTYIIRLNNQNQTPFYITVTSELWHEFIIPE
jgi:hypothetical protein